MLVEDIMKLARFKLPTLSVVKDEEALITFIYLGVSELFRRFNLKVSSETVQTNKNLALYELRNTDVNLILGIYDATGRQLAQTDILNSRDYDYKLVNYRSFLLRAPYDGVLYTVYKASPVRFKAPEDIIDLPDAMTEALLTYITYMAHSTVNTDNMNTTSMYGQRFDLLCQGLEMQGYKIALETDSLALQTKGYV